MCFLAAQNPCFDVNRDRGFSDPNQIGVDGNHVADEHWFAKIHRLDRHRDRARFCHLGREDSAADIHPAEQPAAENVAVLVGVGWHRHRADRQVAAGLVFRIQWGVNGLAVGHGGAPDKNRII